jgi:ATP-dependent RNA circularization protein (DNA/RNA ligase family)
MKPLGHKSYGSIPHLQGSRLGPGDHHAEPGQCRIATEKKRDKHDFIIVQEKMDGGNVSVAKKDGNILALTRAGYLAESSQYRTHHAFKYYVDANENRFSELLSEGERVCGEWMLTAVGTRYNLPHEPFVTFDIMREKTRLPYLEFVQRVAKFELPIPQCLSIGEPCAIETILPLIEVSNHGAIDKVEGAVWRVERKGAVDFLVKYVRPEKQDGIYLSETVLNGVPEQWQYLTHILK